MYSLQIKEAVNSFALLPLDVQDLLSLKEEKRSACCSTTVREKEEDVPTASGELK